MKKNKRLFLASMVVIIILLIGVAYNQSSNQRQNSTIENTTTPSINPTGTTTDSASPKPVSSPSTKTTTEKPSPNKPTQTIDKNTPIVDINGIKILPADNMWNTPIDTLPLHKNSANYINSIGSVGMHPDFGTFWDGEPIGIPYNIVTKDQAKVKVSFDYADESDVGPYPIPSNPLIEGGSDKHMILIQKDTNTLYELFAVEKNSKGEWHAGSGAIWHLDKNETRTNRWTSADAAGLAIFPGLVRYDEVYQKGEINHALRITLRNIQKAYIKPASHSDGSTNSNYPPMGLRMRLKSSFDITKFDSKIQVILRAMKKYGIVLADTGSPMYLTGTHDTRWNDEALSALSKVRSTDFEAVYTGEIVPYFSYPPFQTIMINSID